MRPDFDSEEIRSEVCEIVVFLAQASEFFMFGALMIVDMMIFGFMAYNYTYVDPNAVTDNDEKASNIDSGSIKCGTRGRSTVKVKKHAYAYSASSS